jgi:aspartyl-tRNA(Asn)/glutamyl-tRNA(Gln) amidotransferase subunit C
MEHGQRIGRVVGDRPADDRDRTGLGAARPSAQVNRFGAGQQAQAGLDAAHHDQGPTGAAREPEPLDPPPGEGQRLDPWRLGHRRIVAASIEPMITRADVEKVAELARLHLTDEELDQLEGQLSRILEAIEVLRDVDTSQVGPTASVLNVENVMRDDLPADGITREAALANAPLREGDHLRVPLVLKEGR